MADFFDWLTAADQGSGAAIVRERFKLSEAEMRRATEALAPAVLIALQQLSANQTAWGNFLNEAGRTWLSQGRGSPGIGGFPEDFATRLFGSTALADSVTRQASTMAGIAPDVLAKMMPELGAMTLRTMMQMAGAASAQPGAMPSDAGGQAVAEMMRRSANAVEAFSRPSSEASRTTQASIESLFANALKGGFPWMGSAAAPTPAPSPSRREPSDGPSSTAFPFFGFAPLMDAIARSGKPYGGDGGERAADNSNASSRGAPEAGSRVPDPLSGMTRAMEAGRSLQETYAQEMLALFDRHRRTD